MGEIEKKKKCGGILVSHGYLPRLLRRFGKLSEALEQPCTNPTEMIAFLAFHHFIPPGWGHLQ